MSKYSNFFNNVKDISEKCSGFGDYNGLLETKGYCFGLVHMWGKFFLLGDRVGFYTPLQLLTDSYPNASYPDQKLSDIINARVKARRPQVQPDGSTLASPIRNDPSNSIEKIRAFLNELLLYLYPFRTQLYKDDLDDSLRQQDAVAGSKYDWTPTRRSNDIAKMQSFTVGFPSFPIKEVCRDVPQSTGIELQPSLRRVLCWPVIGNKKDYNGILANIIQRMGLLKVPFYIGFTSINHEVGLIPDGSKFRMFNANYLFTGTDCTKSIGKEEIGHELFSAFPQKICTTVDLRALAIRVYVPAQSQYQSMADGFIVEQSRSYSLLMISILHKKKYHLAERGNAGYELLYIACLLGESNLVAALLNLRFVQNINKLLPYAAFPLYTACQNGHVRVVELLLKCPGIEINRPMNGGATSLYIACERGRVRVVELLLQRPVIEINRANNDGATSLMVACQQGHVRVVELLLKKRPDIAINRAMNDGSTPFFIACQNGQVRVVELLLKKRPDIAINRAMNDGETPFGAASRHGHIRVVELLLQPQHHAEIHRAMKNGETPLYTACRNGHLRVVKLLIHHRAEINRAANDGETPFGAASRHGHIRVVELLLQPQHHAEIHRAMKNGETPLYTACRNGHLRVVKLLIHHRAEINRACNDGETPLYGASRQGHVRVVELLLKFHRLEVNQARVTGTTPLSIARRRNHAEVVKLLSGHPRIDMN